MNNIEFKKFRVADLFSNPIIPNKMLNKYEIENTGKYPVYSSNTMNYGIIGYTDKPDFIVDNENKVFLIFGDHTRSFYIVKESFSITDNVKVLHCPNSISDNVLLYLITCWKKVIPDCGYSRHWQYAKNSIILLPVKDDQIDFDYMEQYIIKIKEKVNKALVLFDKISNLKERVIDTTNWKEFRVGDLFDIDTGSSIPRSQLANGNIPRISVKGINNGITGYFDTSKLDNARHYENFISVSFLGDVFYHPYTASCEMKVHSLKLKNHTFTEATGLYMATIIKKAIISAYSYVDQLSSSKLKKDKIFIKLPINKDNQIDFDYIENYVLKTQNKVQNHLNNLTSL